MLYPGITSDKKVSFAYKLLYVLFSAPDWIVSQAKSSDTNLIK